MDARAMPVDAVSLADLWGVARRRWWIILLPPVLAALVVVWSDRTRAYQTTFRATVLIPGDTEIPGDSERPELMVLDDLPAVVASLAFAEMVQAAMPDPKPRVEDVRRALSATRYSRVATVKVTSADAEEASRIAAAAAVIFPEAVNRFMIADGGAPATVRLLDPPGEPSRDRPHQVVKNLVVVAAFLVVGFIAGIVVDRALVGRR